MFTPYLHHMLIVPVAVGMIQETKAVYIYIYPYWRMDAMRFIQRWFLHI